MLVKGLCVNERSCIMRQYALVFSGKSLLASITGLMSTGADLLDSFCFEQSITTIGAYFATTSLEISGRGEVWS